MEQNNSLDTCCICLDDITIPVEPICFPCRDQENAMSCFSMKRICLRCFERYMHLEISRQERPLKQKCVFCPMVCDIHQNSKNKMFRIDYLLMDKFADIEKKCPYDQCNFTGTHLQVARHVIAKCPFYFLECQCGTVCQRQYMKDHVKNCVKYITCGECNVYVLEQEMPRHMYYDHDQTKCFTCHNYISMDKLSDHIIVECPERLVTCEICSAFIRFKLFKSHLRRHVIEISKNVQLIKNKLREEEHTYQHIQKIIRDLSLQHHQEEAELLDNQFLETSVGERSA